MPPCPRPAACRSSIDRTFVSSIDGRYTPGIFGLGWTTTWQTVPERGRLRRRDHQFRRVY